MDVAIFSAILSPRLHVLDLEHQQNAQEILKSSDGIQERVLTVPPRTLYYLSSIQSEYLIITVLYDG